MTLAFGTLWCHARDSVPQCSIRLSRFVAFFAPSVHPMRPNTLQLFLLPSLSPLQAYTPFVFFPLPFFLILLTLCSPIGFIVHKLSSLFLLYPLKRTTRSPTKDHKLIGHRYDISARHSPVCIFLTNRPSLSPALIAQFPSRPNRGQPLHRLYGQ